ncbi:phospholipase A [Photobacterium damselae]|uniref:phospholipase A n=1 Tax=Photobacterium damselae TaxID=38293 RepID=UPI0015F68AAD|nr:phospholipase A [Photobacterium damselae]MBA5685371.1 phospholipase A [Photobacterium damselae subsp. damselae]
MNRNLLMTGSMLLAAVSYMSHAHADELASPVNNPLDYSSNNSLLLEQYKDNFILPVYYTSNPNKSEYSPEIPGGDHFSNTKVNFQISLKYKMFSNLLTDNDAIYVAYTQRSNWQAYVSSAYFQDNEYEPSLFWSFPAKLAETSDWQYAGTTFGFVHQSNGRGGNDERSWNRAFADVSFKNDQFTLSVKPWLRLDMGGRDYNSNIENYLGNGRISLNWMPTKEHSLTFTVRNALESGFSRSYEKLTWNFPIYKRLRGYMLVESGYGLSISDYDHYDNGVGMGIAF